MGEISLSKETWILVVKMVWNMNKDGLKYEDFKEKLFISSILVKFELKWWFYNVNKDGRDRQKSGGECVPLVESVMVCGKKWNVRGGGLGWIFIYTHPDMTRF